MTTPGCPHASPGAPHPTGPTGPTDPAHPARLATPAEEVGAHAGVERAGDVWRLRSLAAARTLLRARGATTQAGFTAEFIPTGALRHHPILLSDGPGHDEQRRKVGRFFAPRAVARYEPEMARCADALLAEASGRPGAGGVFGFDDLALLYAVEVTGRIVGLTASPVAPMARRLDTFFRQPPVDMSRADLGRSPGQWARAAFAGLVPLARFWWADVRPAIRAHRRAEAADRPDDVVSHLLDEGYTDADILVECVTYGTAGMVTTREFMSMAAWHLLRDDALRAAYLAADRDARHGILEEILRLEPVVGHLYRRVTEAVEIRDGDRTHTLAPGDLVDVCVRDANADPAAFDSPARLRPGRRLPRGVGAAGLTFGDGAHLCPGRPLAVLEADVLLTRLLARDVRLVRAPDVTWDDLVAGYRLRGLRVAVRRG